jgi:hypothetical protein
MGVSCVVVSSHRGIGNIGRNPGRYTGNPCSRFDPLRRHSRGGSFDHPATSGVFPSRTDRLLCCVAPDGESDFLKDRWLPGTWESADRLGMPKENESPSASTFDRPIFLDAARDDLERPVLKRPLQLRPLVALEPRLLGVSSGASRRFLASSIPILIPPSELIQSCCSPATSA